MQAERKRQDRTRGGDESGTRQSCVLVSIVRVRVRCTAEKEGGRQHTESIPTGSDRIIPKQQERSVKYIEVCKGKIDPESESQSSSSVRVQGLFPVY